MAKRSKKTIRPGRPSTKRKAVPPAPRGKARRGPPPPAAKRPARGAGGAGRPKKVTPGRKAKQRALSKPASKPARSTNKTAAQISAARAHAAILGIQRKKVRRRRNAAAAKLGNWRKQRSAGDPEAETFRAAGGRVKKSKPRRGELPRISLVVDDLPFGLPPEAIGEIAEQTAFEARAQVDELGANMMWKQYRFQWTIWKLTSPFNNPEEAAESDSPEWEEPPRAIASSYRHWAPFISTVREHVTRSVTPRDTEESRRVWVIRLAVYAIPFRRG